MKDKTKDTICKVGLGVAAVGTIIAVMSGGSVQGVTDVVQLAGIAVSAVSAVVLFIFGKNE